MYDPLNFSQETLRLALHQANKMFNYAMSVDDKGMATRWSAERTRLLSEYARKRAADADFKEGAD